jgi:GNAT superfamily N-acetyltransferase
MTQHFHARWQPRRLLPEDDLPPNVTSRERRTFVVLRDGSRIVVRPYQAEDRSSVKALFERLSQQSLVQRFHSAGFRLTDQVLDLATAGHALVAEVEGLMVGLASYYPEAGTHRAEAAMVVDDAYQGRGIGLALGRRLYLDAQKSGIRQVRAGVHGSNRVMIKLLRRLQLPMKTTWGYGVIQVEITVESDPADGESTIDRCADAA